MRARSRAVAGLAHLWRDHVTKNRAKLHTVPVPTVDCHTISGWKEGLGLQFPDGLGTALGLGLQFWEG